MKGRNQNNIIIVSVQEKHSLSCREAKKKKAKKKKVLLLSSRRNRFSTVESTKKTSFLSYRSFYFLMICHLIISINIYLFHYYCYWFSPFSLPFFSRSFVVIVFFLNFLLIIISFFLLLYFFLLSVFFSLFLSPFLSCSPLPSPVLPLNLIVFIFSLPFAGGSPKLRNAEPDSVRKWVTTLK